MLRHARQDLRAYGKFCRSRVPGCLHPSTCGRARGQTLCQIFVRKLSQIRAALIASRFVYEFHHLFLPLLLKYSSSRFNAMTQGVAYFRSVMEKENSVLCLYAPPPCGFLFCAGLFHATVSN
jgi:hypothetical protein